MATINWSCEMIADDAAEYAELSSRVDNLAEHYTYDLMNVVKDEINRKVTFNVGTITQAIV